jgi:TatD DNase family protein
VVFVDTHCHLNLPEFNEDRDEVIDRALREGVKSFIVPAIDEQSGHAALELAKRHSEISVALGFHPYAAGEVNTVTLQRLKEACRDEKVVAVGEIGLDYYRAQIEPAIQIKALEAQLELAGELGKPVIIHQRQAEEDLLSVLKAWDAKGSTGGVLHSFAGNIQLAQWAITKKLFLGIGGAITFVNAKTLAAAVKELPLEIIVLETDAPYLSPHPFRGRRNEPARLPLIAEKIAAIKELSLDEVASTTTMNARSLFNLANTVSV